MLFISGAPSRISLNLVAFSGASQSPTPIGDGPRANPAGSGVAERELSVFLRHGHNSAISRKP
jgi:hypothetical protein